MTRIADEPCIVLHTRAYRESSLLVSVLSLNHGLVTMVAKGVRGGRRGRALQPFTAARVGWTGRSSLATLTGFEALRQHWFHGEVLACAFYLTELLNRLLGEREAHPRLYAGLEWALETLERDQVLALRSFEKLLLEELGYGLDFQLDVDGRPIEVDSRYRLIADRGFARSKDGYSGADLLRIGSEDFDGRKVRSTARALFRAALAPHLGPKPLLSRQMLVPGS
jgi:DNA repair protein RecO (recombination protein O)